MRRRDDDGMILVQVLAVLAVASAAVLVLIGLQQAAILRGQRAADTAQALAWARGGETSVATALRRDAAEAPKTDHLGEPWARVAQVPVALPGGGFTLRLRDANDRINLNALTGTLGRARLTALAQAAGLTPAAAAGLAALLDQAGPLEDLDHPLLAGLAPEALARVRDLITALPGRAPVNINSAGAPVLALLLGNPAAARALVARRDRQGYLTPGDLADLAVVLPPGLGFTSNLWWVETTATFGASTQTLVTLLHRRPARGGTEVVALRRLRPPPPVMPPP